MERMHFPVGSQSPFILCNVLLILFIIKRYGPDRDVVAISQLFFLHPLLQTIQTMNAFRCFLIFPPLHVYFLELSLDIQSLS